MYLYVQKRNMRVKKRWIKTKENKQWFSEFCGREKKFPSPAFLSIISILNITAIN